MPALTGIDATYCILKNQPGVKVLALSSFGDAELIDHMLQVGASGYLLKQESASILVESIRTVWKGETAFSPSVPKHLKTRPRVQPANVGVPPFIDLLKLAQFVPHK